MKLINKIVLSSFLAVLPQFAIAEEITVTVKGMVCSFCAQGLKKTFGKIGDVKKIEVDLENKFVKLDVKDGSALTDDEIETTIRDSGFDVLRIERVKGD